MRFETKIYNYSADEKIIGAEVTVYDEEGDKIDSIVVTDQTKLQELEEALENIDSRYVEYTSLNDILANLDESTPINATKLNGLQGDAFVLAEDIAQDNISVKPKPHAVPNTTYGPGTTSNYGHIKLRDNLTAGTYVSGEALSSHQGKILNDKIEALESNMYKNDMRILISRASDGQGEQGSQIIVGYGSGNGLVARIDTSDTSFNKNNRVVRLLINGIIYDRVTNASGITPQVTINLERGAYLVTALMVGYDGKNPVSEQKFLIVE